ncbi:MAG: hypothetical protein GY719_13685 [bacterium]|nr:hypothetical protein [bacterium]
MTTILKRVADVFGGVRPTKQANRPVPLTEVRLLQPRDLAPGAIDWDLLPQLAASPDSKHQLRAGDVLVLLRGAAAPATLVQSPPPNPVVVSNHVAVVRPELQRILPGYLATILNHPETKSRIQAATSGTTVPFLSIKSLKELELPLPPLAHQKKVAEVDHLRRRFHSLSAKKSRLADRLVNETIRQAVMGGETDAS